MPLQWATVLEGETYFQSRMHTAAWDIATVSERNVALQEATTRLNFLNFKTVIRDMLDADDIPLEIMNATIELALSLLDGVRPEFEHRNLSVEAENITGARTTYNRASYAPYLAAGIPSLMAWAWLQPFLARYRSVRLNRVS